MQPLNRTVVTVDGLAGSGKTTVSKMLAQRLGFAHLNSGLIYRALAWLALSKSINPNSAAEVADLTKHHILYVDTDRDSSTRVSIDGQDITAQLSEPRVSEATSIISQYPTVRAALLSAQRLAFPGRNLVAEGRDMGTVVFPDAQKKFFITASEMVRTERRLAQLKAAGLSDKLLKEQIQVEIRERDLRDTQRAASPTKPAKDAIVVDNSTEILTNVVESMYHAVTFSGLHSN